MINPYLELDISRSVFLPKTGKCPDVPWMSIGHNSQHTVRYMPHGRPQLMMRTLYPIV